jgi:DNA repair protein RadC
MEQYKNSMRGTMKRISDLPLEERPREKMMERGAGSLSNAELLAILLRVGVEGESAVALGAQLLEEFQGIAGIHAAEPDELCAVHGIGQAKAAQIKAALELGSRLHQETMEDRPLIDSPEKAYEVLKFDILQNDRETLWMLALNTRHRLIKKKKLYQGTRSFSSVRVAEIFEFALLQHAAAIILAHNHPSGEPYPSQEDLRITQEIRKAGEILEIPLLDHLIIVPGAYQSLKKEQKGVFDGSDRHYA